MTGEQLQKSADPSFSSVLPIQVLNPIESAHQYTFVSYQPTVELAVFIDSIWVMRWDLSDQKPFTIRILSSPYVTLTFTNYGAMITGVTTGVFEYQIAGSGVVYGVLFRPGGFRPFYHQSVSAITDKVMPAELVFPSLNGAVTSDILQAASDREGIDRIEQHLIGAAQQTATDIQLIDSVIERSLDDPSCSVGVLAQQSGLSERQLQHLFKEHVGVGLKWIMLRNRLQKAAQLAAREKTPNWATVAADLNYSHQSHFVNDFKKTIGETPVQYATRVRRTRKD